MGDRFAVPESQVRGGGKVIPFRELVTEALAEKLQAGFGCLYSKV
jgi:hypothetical protein